MSDPRFPGRGRARPPSSSRGSHSVQSDRGTVPTIQRSRGSGSRSQAQQPFLPYGYPPGSQGSQIPPQSPSASATTASSYLPGEPSPTPFAVPGGPGRSQPSRAPSSGTTATTTGNSAQPTSAIGSSGTPNWLDRVHEDDIVYVGRFPGDRKVLPSDDVQPAISSVKLYDRKTGDIIVVPYDYRSPRPEDLPKDLFVSELDDDDIPRGYPNEMPRPKVAGDREFILTEGATARGSRGPDPPGPTSSGISWNPARLQKYFPKEFEPDQASSSSDGEGQGGDTSEEDPEPVSDDSD